MDSTTSTIAEGLATRTAFALPQRILRALLDDFVLVEDADIGRACLTYLEGVRQLVEPAGAASLAGAIQLADRLRDRRVAIVCSGGNVSMGQLRQLVQADGAGVAADPLLHARLDTLPEQSEVGPSGSFDPARQVLTEAA